MDAAIHALRNNIVDDVHLTIRFADLLETLTKRIRSRFVRMARSGGRDSTPLPGQGQTEGNTNGNTHPPMMPPQHTGNQNGRGQGVQGSGQPAQPNPSQAQQHWNAGGSSYDYINGINNYSGRNTPNPLLGISTEAIDMGDPNVSIMPPPSYGFGGGNNPYADPNSLDHSSSNTGGTYINSADGNGGLGQPNDGGGYSGYAPDWLALPLDPLLNSYGAAAAGAGVSQTEVGPDVGGFDLLEILLSEMDGVGA
jgi:hypothetical protein